MQIIINGQERILPDGTSLSQAVAQCAKRPELVIVELNGKIVERKAWPDTALAAGDRVELVTFVGGG
ncbi:MAG: sulfur carrier protein ThiS [Candidatus Omnitrophica bacterium]|nr:sulfur carrier protein ThiS [Candidatus Omnitrophota bacterium]